jgi:transcriptional regulator with XRE-family HTH domain
MTELGQEVRRLREEKGWNQAELAVHAGIGVSGLSHIETGKRNPSAVTLQKIAEALSVGVGDLYPKAQAPLPFESAQNAPNDGDGLTLEDVRRFLETRLGSAWLALPEDEWAHWWRGVSRAEAALRRRLIAAEYRLLAEEFMATHGKADREPELVPRGGHWGNVFSTLFGRNFETKFFAPQKDESTEEFKERQRRGVPAPRFYEDLRESEEQARRAASEAS